MNGHTFKSCPFLYLCPYSVPCRYEVNPHFGGADGLRALIKAAHDKQMYVMVDVVANHMVIIIAHKYVMNVHSHCLFVVFCLMIVGYP